MTASAGGKPVIYEVSSLRGTAVLLIGIGVFIGYVWASFKSTPAVKYEYGVLNTDVDLEQEDRMTSVNYGKQEITYLNNPKMFGVIKKGSIVKTPVNVIRKGNRMWIQVSAFISDVNMSHIGNNIALQKYLNENESFYSQSKTAKGTITKPLGLLKAA